MAADDLAIDTLDYDLSFVPDEGISPGQVDSGERRQQEVQRPPGEGQGKTGQEEDVDGPLTPSDGCADQDQSEQEQDVEHLHPGELGQRIGADRGNTTEGKHMVFA